MRVVETFRGAVVSWLENQETGVFHATTDGRRSVCAIRAVLREPMSGLPEMEHRSNDLMTCLACQDLVMRAPRRPSKEELLRRLRSAVFVHGR